ncbi:hypothetical protein EG799_01550 [Aurantiacibacter spongiae]|uniref:Uncharacterized protein n=1 Tax=Aurantiacibacter spongiae TaxID=2488860 RepID=A0A3N5CV11_9SPHN|nr:hypothetical protein EG799_01550 [Aurantiacibacter spongiae]
MNLSTEQMQFLADKGLTIQEVIEFASIGPARSAAAERQARYRAKKKAEDEADDVTRDVTRDGNGDETDPLSRPPLSSPQTPQQTPPTHTPEHIPRARKGHRLPDDWKPKPLSGDVATAVSRWPDGAVDRELAKFRDWAASATGANARKSDWDATWRNWLRRRDDELPRKDRNDRPAANNDEIQNPFARVVARRAAERSSAER